MRTWMAYGACLLLASCTGRGERGVIKGRAVQITHGIPGQLAGQPERPMPAEGVGGTVLHFRDRRTYTVTAAGDGSYSAELPPGVYRIGFILPGDARSTDPFDRPLPKDQREAEIVAGQTVERDIPVLELFVD